MPCQNLSESLMHSHDLSSKIQGHTRAAATIYLKEYVLFQVLVWHTRTEPVNIGNEEKMLRKNFEQSDPNVEV